MSIQDKLAAKYIADSGVLGDMAKAHIRGVAVGDIQRIEAAGLMVVDAAESSDAALVEFYKRAAGTIEGEVMDMICEAMPEQFPNDPEYGYITGDHVAQSMVAVLIAAYETQKLTIAELRKRQEVDMEYRSDITLGKRYRDRDTGAVGVATSVHFYRNACERVVLMYLHDGKIMEYSFDAVDLIDVETDVPAKVTKPGGPARTMPSAR